MSAIALNSRGLFEAVTGRKIKAQDKEAVILSEERDIIQALEDLKRELSILYIQFNYMTDPALIDGCIYDIKAANSKYTFYLNKCKERQIKAVV